MSGALGRRRYSNPILVQPDAPERVLERVPFEEYEPGKIVGLDNSVEAPRTRVVDETRLQQLLFDYPGLLPISDIEPAFSPAIPLGREVGTANGPIDVLYISPQGYITIVETKLWRNPGARREVVAQIVDYAKALARWSPADLTAEVSKVLPLPGNPKRALYDHVHKTASELGEVAPDETTFYDTLSRNLSSDDDPPLPLAQESEELADLQALQHLYHWVVRRTLRHDRLSDSATRWRMALGA